MKLNAQDIAQIKTFVAKRGFTEPDLQIEIIDHMVCRVEDMMSDNHDFSLANAIQLAHSEFGIMGFSVFEDAMRSNLQKRYIKIFRNLYLANFNWKNLPLMAAFIYLVNTAFSVINKPELMFTSTGIILMLALVVNGIINSGRYKRYTKMLTFKMGSVYLVISIVVFQLYNVLMVQLKLYRHINPNFTGLLFGGVLLMLLITFYTINKTQQHAVASCRELEERYLQIVS